MPIHVGLMKPGAVAYGREIHPEYLLPSAPKTCGSWVINVADLTHVIYIATRDVARTLHYQNTSPMQQVADGGDGRNVHMNWIDSRCRRFHFAVGHDTYVLDEETPLGRICITAHELAFVIGEKRRAPAPNGRVWMPGLARPR